MPGLWQVLALALFALVFPPLAVHSAKECTQALIDMLL